MKPVNVRKGSVTLFAHGGEVNPQIFSCNFNVGELHRSTIPASSRYVTRLVAAPVLRGPAAGCSVVFTLQTGARYQSPHVTHSKKMSQNYSFNWTHLLQLHWLARDQYLVIMRFKVMFFPGECSTLIDYISILENIIINILIIMISVMSHCITYCAAPSLVFPQTDVEPSRVFTIGLLLCNNVEVGRTSQHVVNMHLQHKPKVWLSPHAIKTPAWTRLVLSSNTRNCTVTLTREKWQF